MEDDSVLSTSSSVTPSGILYVGSAMQIDESYLPLPWLYMVFFAVWLAAASTWVYHTWRYRHFQTSNLQWAMASVPLLKALQLALNFIFWYTCVNFEMCSLWIAFGVYVTGILFETAYFVSLFLISHGYCIMCERLSVPERRLTAALGFVLYLSLVGYKASVPYFTAFVLLNYVVSFFVIFRHISKNLSVLHEQLNFMEEEGVQAMHDALSTKYNMFKKFQGAVHIVGLVEILIYLNVAESSENYWFRTLVREWAQLCIFMYIGWNFRIQEASPRFSVMPALKSNWDITAPPIYSIEVDATEFEELASQEWHVAVPTSSAHVSGKSSDPLLVIVQHPRSARHAQKLSQA